MKRIALLLLLALAPIAAHAIETTPIPCTEDPCESEPITPTDPTLAQGKFVDCSAAINGSGTQVSPWNRLASVTGMQPSQDLWLKTGTTCNETLSVTWSGTAADYVEVGTYYVSGTTALKSRPANPTAWPKLFAYPNPRAILSGTYAATCSIARGGTGNCLVDTGTARPTASTAAMVELRGNYQRVLGLQVKDSAGICISAPVTATHHHEVLESFCNYSASSAIAFPKGTDQLADSNYVLGASVASSKGDGLFAENGGGILALTDTSTAVTAGEYDKARVLLTHNEVAGTYGEGIKLRQISGVVMRGNLLYSSASPHVLIDRAQNVIAEQNEILGNTGGAFVAQRAFAVASEDSPDPTRWVNLHDIVIRANVIANTSTGLNVGMQPGIAAAGKTTSVQFVGNTVLTPTSSYIDMPFLAAANVGAGFVLANNAFDLLAGTANCNMPTSANFSRHHNGWNAQPADLDCRGTPGDVTGPSLVTSAFSWATAGVNNIPTADQFALGTGSLLAGAAPSIATSISALVALQNAAYASVTMPCAGIDSTLLSKSYECTGRPSQDMGAMDGTVGGGGGGLIAATGKFVDCSLMGSGNGSFATPWNRIANITGMTAGTDLWFKEGTTCPVAALSINWAGTAADRVVVGAYKVISGAAYQGLTNAGNLTPYGTESAGTRPVIQGTYANSCRPSCLFNVTGAIPSNANSFLVNVTQPYVTVQDLRATASAAGGIGSDASGTYAAPTDLQLIVQRNVIDHCATSCLFTLDAKNVIFRFNAVSYAALNYADGLANDWGNAIGGGRGRPNNILIEGNFVHDSWGEGIGTYRSTFVVARGNYLANNRRVQLYPAGSNDIVYEQNLVVDGPLDTEGVACPRCGLPVAVIPTGMDMTLEEPAQHSLVPDAGRRVLFRNNVVIGSSPATCMNWGSSAANEGTWWLSGKHVGNTCYVQAGSRWFGAITGGNIGLIEPTEKIEVANNLMFGGSSTNNCTMPNYPTVIQLHHNGHTLAYSALSNCGTTGDVVSTNVAMPSFSFNTASKTNFPRWTDVKPQSTTAFKDNGAAMTSTYLTIAAWPHVSWFTWVNPDCGPGGQLAPADWAKLLYADGCNKPRGAIPDPGAIEQ